MVELRFNKDVSFSGSSLRCSLICASDGPANVATNTRNRKYPEISDSQLEAVQ